MKVISRIAILAAFSLSSCLEESSEGPTQEDFDFAMEDKELAEEKLEKAYQELDEYDLRFEKFDELEKKADSADQMKKELDDLKSSKEKVEEEMRKLRQEYEDYQKKYEAKVRKAGVGEEFASLEVGEQTLSQVVISSVTEQVVQVRHADGFASLNSVTAPTAWKERFFLRSEEEIAQRAAELAAFLNPPVVSDEEESQPERPVSDYRKRKLAREQDKAAMEALVSKVGTAIVSVSGQNSQGSGFFVQDGITTYLYTTASLLSNNPGFQVRDVDGGEWSKFAHLEIAEGHDLVRLALSEPVEDLLKFHSAVGEIEGGQAVAILTLAQGEIEVAKRETKLRTLEEETITLSTSSLKNSVGGAITNSQGEVLAIVIQTRKSGGQDEWGGSSQVVFSQAAARLDREYDWSKTTLERFFSAEAHFTKFNHMSRLIHAFGALRAGNKGVELNQRVGGNLTIKDIFEENKDLNIVKRVTRFHETLSNRNSTMSQSDIDRKLRSFFNSALLGAGKQTLKKSDFSSYHQADVDAALAFREDGLRALRHALESVK